MADAAGEAAAEVGARSGPATAPAPERAAARGWGSRLLLLLPLLLFAALAALFARQLGAGDPSRLPSVLIGKSAPTFDLPPLEGQKSRAGDVVPGLSSASLRTGGPVTVVNVWASWCAPCQVEHPLLMELAKDPGLRIVGINYKDKPENARRFLAALGNPYGAIGTDDSGRTAIEWGVYGVPETFVVSADGVVRHKLVGPLTPEGLPAFRDKLRAAASAK